MTSCRNSLLLVAAILVIAAAQVPRPAIAQSANAVVATSPFERRIEQVLDRLDLLIQDDLKASQTGAPISESKARALRRAVERLVDTGRDRGQRLDSIASRLQFAARERFGDAIPVAFTNAEGDLDARGLINGVVGRSTVEAKVERDPSYLSAISEEGGKTSVGAAPGKTAKTEESSSAAVEEEPAPLLETDAERETRLAVRDRVEEDLGQRYIIVQPGDTLGSLARDIYGDMLLFRRIYEANRSQIANPNVITPGARLLIP